MLTKLFAFAFSVALAHSSYTVVTLDEVCPEACVCAALYVQLNVIPAPTCMGIQIVKASSTKAGCCGLATCPSWSCSHDAPLYLITNNCTCDLVFNTTCAGGDNGKVIFRGTVDFYNPGYILTACGAPSTFGDTMTTCQGVIVTGETGKLNCVDCDRPE